MRLIKLLIVCVVLAAGLSVIHADEGWIRIVPGGATRCAHDTPFMYWVRKGSVNRLLVFLQGGGGCWSAETCRAGSNFYKDAVTESDNPTGQGGIFALENPENPFKDYWMVYIPSCTGDVYWGDKVEKYPDGDNALTIYHRGFVNASTAVTWAYEQIPDPESVFVTGCSAGSAGSILLAPYINEQYSAARVTQLGDSLSFTYHRPLNMHTNYAAHDNFPPWIPALAQIQPGQLRMPDVYSAIANHYPDQVFAQYNTQADSVQLRFYLALGGRAQNFEHDLAANIAEISANAPNFRAYTAPGSAHCILPLARFYTTETAGVRFRDWVADLAAGKAVDNVKCPTCE